MDHKWGRLITELGVGGLGATMCSRLLPPYPVGRCLTNAVTPTGFTLLITLPDTGSGEFYSYSLVPTGGLHFPYGFPVEPDEPV